MFTCSQRLYLSPHGERSNEEIYMWTGPPASMVRTSKYRLLCWLYQDKRSNLHSWETGTSWCCILSVNSLILIDFAGSVETRLWTRISTNLSALRSRRTLPKVNGRSVSWLSHSTTCWNSSIRIGVSILWCWHIMHFFAVLFSHLLSDTEVFSLSLSLCPCSKRLTPPQWCATCGSYSWARVLKDPVRSLPQVPAMDICSQRKTRKRRMIWGMGRRRAVSDWTNTYSESISDMWTH